MKKKMLLLLAFFTMFITGCESPSPVPVPVRIFTIEEQNIFRNLYNIIAQSYQENCSYTSVINDNQLEIFVTCTNAYSYDNPVTNTVTEWNVGDISKTTITKENGIYVCREWSKFCNGDIPGDAIVGTYGKGMYASIQELYNLCAPIM